MRIAIIGYGKMGKTIERLALEKGHTIALITNNKPLHSELINKDVQIAIEFSNPKSAAENIKALLQSNIPVVCGTTGWLDDYYTVKKEVIRCNGSFIYASNYSLGVNLFFEMAEKATQLMYEHPQYKVWLEEIHHTEKLDAPSGTAITLAEKIIQASSFQRWTLNHSETEKDLPIYAKREEDVKGTHRIHFESEVDRIQLEHKAFSRDGFALGAIKAAEYIIDKKGIFTMRDVLGFS